MGKAALVLEDGRYFEGTTLGSSKTNFGEVVFNTGMTGYQEILTDPSYAGQIITLTYPEIGNYGCNDEDYESTGSYVKGLVIKNYSPVVSNWRAEESLEDFLNKHDIPAICDVDTRALTKHIRDKGAMRAVICSKLEDFGYDETKNNLDEVVNKLIQEVKASPSMEGLDLASEVTCKETYHVDALSISGQKTHKIIAFDFGIKTNILKRLSERGCEVEVVPANTPASYVLEKNPDGVFLSNGPGDPAAVDYAIETVKELTQKFDKPIFGICLGSQLLGLAAGAETFKLKFGHRGSNQPIKNLDTSKIEISSHNHGFAINKDKIPNHLEITHLNINDDTVAGIKFKDKDIFAVQYHPEASPGPHDSDYLFDNFVEMMQKHDLPLLKN